MMIEKNISARKILIGNLPINASDEDLRSLLATRINQVISVTIPLDSRGRNAGHAFVILSSRESALKSVEELHGLQFNGRTLNISLAEPSKENELEKKRAWYAFWIQKDKQP